MTRIGNWIDNLSNQMDEKGKPRYSLEQLLRPPQPAAPSDPLTAFAHVQGAVARRVKRKPEANVH